MRKEGKKEKVLDIKGTFEGFVGEEMPELSQEEAIKSYREEETISNQKPKKKIKQEIEEQEENEDMRKLKKELLESLERVNELAKKIFEDKETIRDKEDLKIKQKDKEKEKNRDDVIAQMRKTMQGEKEKQERSREE